MVRAILSATFLVWALGFLWFAIDLPQPAQRVETDAVIVATGSPGRIDRGLYVLEQGLARRLLVSGVDPEVRPGEFAAQFQVSQALMTCCVSLGFMAEDTRGNADETAQWVKANGITSLRLVTTDWHMRRAAGELDRQLHADVVVVRDAVPSEPRFKELFEEYHKLIASHIAGWLNI